MIYITLGTQGADFSRCLKMVEQLIEEENIQDEVIAQVGNTAYRPKNIKCFEYVTETDYQKYIAEADVIVTHAGSGALFSCIKKGKKAIAVARLAKYGEMINDHQTELVRKLTEGGYMLDGTYNMKNAWRKVKDFTPRTNDFECGIASKIEEMLDNWNIKKINNG